MPTNLILAGVISGQKKWTESNSKDTVYLHVFYTFKWQISHIKTTVNYI